MPLRVAVLAKQVPRFEELRLGADGRLERAGHEAEINPYCRRAIAKGVELARATGGTCTVFTLGPPQAADVLAEAIAWGADDGVLVSDPAFAGADTLATARALAAAIARSGPFGLILGGLNSVDGDTGQVGPQIAELLDLPFLSAVRELSIDGDRVTARCERDDGFVTANLRLPALLTAAERLCQPCKVPAGERGDAGARIRVVTAAELGDGPWGQDGSPTQVGDVRILAHERPGAVLSGPLGQQVRQVAEMIKDSAERLPRGVPTGHVPPTGGDGPIVAVIAEPGGERVTQELVGASARLAAEIGGTTALITTEALPPTLAWTRGADNLVTLGAGPCRVPEDAADVADGLAAEDVAVGVALWARRLASMRPGSAGTAPAPGEPQVLPWAVLAPSTSWGREVAGRLSVLLSAGLTGDAVGLEVASGRLVCWKPAFGGQLVAAVTARSAVQMATVRPGVLPLLRPRAGAQAAAQWRSLVARRDRVSISERAVDDEPERLSLAGAVVCVGQGVDPSRYGELKPLLDVLGAELAGTRKVTDAGRLPRSRQIGLTGRAVAPAVYVLLGASGKFNHIVGIRGAGLVVAVNADPDAPVFSAADAGIVGDWAEVVPMLAAELADLPLGVT